MAGEAEHQQPRRSGDGDRGEHYKDLRDAALNGQDDRPAGRHRQADVTAAIRGGDSA